MNVHHFLLSIHNFLQYVCTCCHIASYLEGLIVIMTLLLALVDTLNKTSISIETATLSHSPHRTYPALFSSLSQFSWNCGASFFALSSSFKSDKSSYTRLFLHPCQIRLHRGGGRRGEGGKWEGEGGGGGNRVIVQCTNIHLYTSVWVKYVCTEP